MSPSFSRFKQRVIYVNGKLGINALLRKYADWYEGRANKPLTLLDKEAKGGWSIVVITDGRNNESLRLLLASASRELAGTPYEIIIVGPELLAESLAADRAKHPLKLIPYKERILWGVPGWITKKKNLGIRSASYDKLVVTHDYIAFDPGWKKGYDVFEDFAACTNIILDKDGKRHVDWVVFDYPGIGQALLPYNASCSEYQYLNGTYFVVKRDFMLDNLLDEKLRWGEGEDVEWSKRVRSRVGFKLNQRSSVRYTKPKPAIAPEWIERGERLAKIFGLK